MYKVTLLAILIVVMGFSNSIQAQKVKVIDQSAKKKPNWVGGLEKNFIITMASANSLESAQQNALNNVKEQIISSVAENIRTSSDFYKKESINNNNTNFSEEFTTATQTQAANIPFIKGISLNKVEEYYWEKVGAKKSDKVTFHYYLKYPFTQIQLMRLIAEYEKAESLKTKKLESLINSIDTLGSVEKMSQTIKELEVAADGFIDIDPRRGQANSAIAKTKAILRNIGIETISNTIGEIRVALWVGDKSITTTRKPSVRSNCAKITSVKSKDTEWIIKYTYAECYDDPDNVIQLTFMSSYGKATDKLYFNINADKIDIFVNSDISFTSNKNCNITINSKYESAFEIEKVVLNFGKEIPIVFDNLGKTFKGKGTHNLDLNIEGGLDKAKYSSKNHPLIKGTIHYKSVKTGERSVYKMFNQNITTSW